MTPETKSVLQTLIRYRDEYSKMWLNHKSYNAKIHPAERTRLWGQSQGLKILTDLMLLHYKTTEEKINAE